MILGMKRSLFLTLLILTLLVGATFGVLIVSAMRSRGQEAAPSIPPTDPLPAASPTQPAALPSTTPSLAPEETPTATAPPNPSQTTTPTTATPGGSITPSPTVDPGATPTITLTPDVDVCAQMDVGFVKATSTIALFRLRNISPIPTTITRIVLDWPEENDAVFNAILDGNVIWAGVEMSSPTEMKAWRGEPGDRSVRGTHALEFFFGTPAGQRGYRLEIAFENGCTIRTAN